MLTYMARNLGGVNLLIVGTYRDIEVDRAHPLSSTLAGLLLDNYPDERGEAK